MDRIIDFLNFFIKEGIVEKALTVAFDEAEETCFLPWDVEINLNLPEIESGEYKEAEVLTCGEDTKLLELFTPLEISFFHELGHFCDFAYRLDYYIDDLHEEWVISTLYENEIHKMWEKLDEIGEQRFGRLVTMRHYRSFGLEKIADENARALMNYYLEHAC